MMSHEATISETYDILCHVKIPPKIESKTIWLTTRDQGAELLIIMPVAMESSDHQCKIYLGRVDINTLESVKACRKQMLRLFLSISSFLGPRSSFPKERTFTERLAFITLKSPPQISARCGSMDSSAK